MEESHIDLSKIFNQLKDETFSKAFPIDGKVFLLSLSGGADSVFLFHFLCFLKENHDFTFEAIHFNHNLRDKESDQDEAFCRKLCNDFFVPLYVKHFTFDKIKNLQDSARKARYKSLKKYLSQKENAFLLTAHHLDDSLESFLIGLHQGRLDSRILSLNKLQLSHKILRPLVSLKKEMIVSYLNESNLIYRTDSSNLDIKYLRNFYRESSIMKYSDDLFKIQNYLTEVEESKKNLFLAMLSGKTINDSNFKIKKEDIKSYSITFKKEFFYYIIQKNFVKFMAKLDVKRIEQLFNINRFGKKTFILSKYENKKLCVIEYSKKYEILVD
ncbi:MAG: tRNA lysidine(34) synthetase TilS [Candidatus Cloacimonadota bacterium]|nr:MAG: tRNA lysidine(34) synthetase TilS [Candidatus Cloacimonadota bacterium]